MLVSVCVCAWYNLNLCMCPHENITRGWKSHLKPLKMTGIIVKIERVDTFGRKVTQKSNREWWIHMIRTVDW